MPDIGTPESGTWRAGDPPHRAPKVLLVAGDSTEDLLHELAGLPASQPQKGRGGPARLAVVDPTARRLELARRVVGQGLPWRGRDSVWFEPRGLLTDGGRLAFMFPGVEPAFQPRVDDVAARFGMRWLLADVHAATDRARPDGHAVARHPSHPSLYHLARGIIASGRLLHHALAQLGIVPDVIAGHSLGEWTAQLAAGVVADDDFEALLGRLEPDAIPLAEATFLALGTGAGHAEDLVADLPQTTVSHDNCPHQAVVCGPASEIETVAGRARSEGIVAQELPFRSGFHSPLFAGHVAAVAEALQDLPVQRPHTPIWSATTCQPYPDDPEAIRQVAAQHLVEPVRFREMTERLHQHGIRAFVQIGPGSLCGFVADTVKPRELITLPANTVRRSGLDQLLRVAAALWVQGQDVNFAPLLEGAIGATAVRPTPATPRPVRLQREISLASQPAFLDHALIRQPAGWPDPTDAFPVVPLTAMVELMMEAAQQSCPGQVPVAVENVAAFRWLPAAPAATVTIQAAPVDEPDPNDGSQGDQTRVQVSIDGHAQATVVMAATYPPAPSSEGSPALADERPSALDASSFYSERHMFHGPAYQGVKQLLSVGTNGSRARLVTLEAPGALLDAAGQLVGHWLIAGLHTQELLLPTSIERIELFGPQPPPGTEVEATLVVTHRDEAGQTSDVRLNVQGRPWARLHGWEHHCFPTDEDMFATFQWPEHATMSTSFGGPDDRQGISVCYERWPDSATRELVMRRYLGRAERRSYAAKTPPEQRQFLLTSVVVKDAVRRWLWDQDGDQRPVFPGEVTVNDDDPERPVVHGPFTAQLWVAVAHAPGVAVAVVTEGSTPGIDVESVAPRRANFETLALTPSERAVTRPARMTRDEWLTCLWAAKEAAAQASGRSLDGRPKDFEMTDLETGRPGGPPHDGHVASVGDLRVAFARLPPPPPSHQLNIAPKQKASNNVVAWTLTRRDTRRGT